MASKSVVLGCWGNLAIISSGFNTDHLSLGKEKRQKNKTHDQAVACITCPWTEFSHKNSSNCK